MDVAIILNFSGLGYEVWITDVIQTDVGMGSVFDTEEDALKYSVDHSVPILNLSSFVIHTMQEDTLRNFLSNYLELTHLGGVVAIKPSKHHIELPKAV